METVDGDSNAARTGTNQLPLAELTLQQFTTALHTPFRVRCEDGSDVALELVEAQAIRSSSGGDAGASFSLLFAGPGDRLLPQRIHAMRHDALGHVDVFIVPVAREADRYRYQAIFNRQSATD